jgi:hypothetical protein
MAMKGGFGGGKKMNGTKHAKPHKGTKKGFGKAGTGKKGGFPFQKRKSSDRRSAGDSSR